MHRLAYLLCPLALIGAATAQELPADLEAQNHGGEVIVIVQTDADESGGFRTHIDPKDSEGETTSVAELLSRSVGVNVRSLGGLGGFASVSIRGASPSHTALVVNGVPISKLGFSSQNVGSLSLSNYSAIDVYRGLIPMQFGSTAMGGVVHLQSFSDDDEDGARVSMGAGSFGARHLRGRLLEKGDDYRWLVAIGYEGATGDYSYFNDNGTNLTQSDDRFEARTNNGFDMVSGTLRGSKSWTKATLEAGSTTGFRSQGIPGSASVQSESTSLRGINQVFDAQLRMPSGKRNGRGLLGAYFVYDQQEYLDRMGEVGLGEQHNRYRTWSGGLTQDLLRAIGTRHKLGLYAEQGIERFRIDNELEPGTDSPRTLRASAAVALSDEIAVGSRLLLLPGARFDLQYTDPSSDWNPVIASSDELEARSETLVSPRLGARYLLGALTIKGSAGRYFRVPTASELFGDRGVVVGNPLLRGEKGITSDLGATYLRDGGLGFLDKVFVQGAVFAARQYDAIVLMPTAGRSAVAQNLGDADLLGSEFAMALSAGRAELQLNHTFIESRQRNTQVSSEGKRLPMRPQHELYLRGSWAQKLWGARSLRPWMDLSYTSGNYLDAGNMSEVPRRLFLGAGFELRPSSHWLVGFSGKNLGDRRVESIALDPAPRPDLSRTPRAVADFLGYPLPGRAFYLTVTLSK